jgi:MFS family permease
MASLRRNVRLLAGFNFLTDFSLFAPVAILYFARVCGSFALGMSIFSIAMLVSALTEVPTGILSDRIGRKKTIIAGSVCSLAMIVFYALGFSYWYLVVGAIFEGLGRAFYSGNNDAFLHEVLVEHGLEHEYDHFLGRVNSLFQIALATSALLGSVIASFSFAWLLWLSVIPQAAKLVLSFWFVDPPRHKFEGNVYSHLGIALKLFWSNRKLRLLSLSSMLGFAFGESSYEFRSAFVNTVWPLWAIGFSKLLANLGAAAGFYFSDRILKKIPAPKFLLLTSIYSKIIHYAALLVPTVVSPALMATTSVYYGVGEVAESTLQQREFTDEQRATMASLVSFGGSLLFAVFSLFLGMVADAWSPREGLLVMHTLSLVTLWLYGRLYWKHGRN